MTHESNFAKEILCISLLFKVHQHVRQFQKQSMQKPSFIFVDALQSNTPRTTPYNISLKHKQLAKGLTDEQRKEITERLYKSKEGFSLPAERMETKETTTAAIGKPNKMRREMENNVRREKPLVPQTNSLYKMAIKYILN